MGVTRARDAEPLYTKGPNRHPFTVGWVARCTAYFADASIVACHVDCDLDIWIKQTFAELQACVRTLVLPECFIGEGRPGHMLRNVCMIVLGAPFFPFFATATDHPGECPPRSFAAPRCHYLFLGGVMPRYNV